MRMGASEEMEKPEQNFVEPVTGTLDEGRYLHIFVKLPGVSEEKIRIDLERNALMVSAADDKRVYNKTIRVPDNVRICKKMFQNEVLELTLEKTIT